MGRQRAPRENVRINGGGTPPHPRLPPLSHWRFVEEREGRVGGGRPPPTPGLVAAWVVRGGVSHQSLLSYLYYYLSKRNYLFSAFLCFVHFCSYFSLRIILFVSRETLLRTAWGYQDLGETRTVDVQHSAFYGRKLGKSCIETVYKTGYKLKMA